MEAIGPVLIVVAIPLMLGWLPRNRLWGFRVPATLSDDGVWYAVNASAGRQAMVIGAVMVALEFVLPLAVRDLVLSVIGTTGLIAILVLNWRLANRLAYKRRARG